MPFNGSGTFSVYTPGTPYVNGTTIDETVVNAVQTDFATGLTNCVTRDGQSPATANLPMGGFRHTGVGNATTRAALTYASSADVQDGTYTSLTAVAGTNTITATAAISLTAYATTQVFTLVPANTNSGATTLNINSIGAKNVFWNGVACVGGEIRQNVPFSVQYDGTQLNIVGNGSALPVGQGTTDQAPVSNGSGTVVWVTQLPKSYAPNPFFLVNQRQNASTSADDTYGLPDRWYSLTQSNPITPSQQTLQENGQATNVRLTQSNVAAQRLGCATILEAADSQALRGKVFTFRPRVRISNSQAVRIAVLEWTGTADSVTSDVVNDWTSGTYTAGNFFLAANLTVTGVGAKTPSAATWTDMDALTVTVGNSCNNLILFVWTEATAAQNVTLDVGKVRFVPGAYAGEIYVPTFDETLKYSMRYYLKSFAYATAPAQGVGASSGEFTVSAAVAGASSNNHYTSVFPVPMFSTPTVTFYNPAAANAQARDVTAAVDCSATQNLFADAKSLHLNFTGNASTSAGNRVGVHYQAVAEL